MIPDRLKAALKEAGSAAFVTQGPTGLHLVATWNSYIEVVDANTLAFPAGGYRKTEANLQSGSAVQMIIGGHLPDGVGFASRGRPNSRPGRHSTRGSSSASRGRARRSCST